MNLRKIRKISAKAEEKEKKMKYQEGVVSQEKGMKKSAALYITMLLIWTVLTVLLWTNFIPKIAHTPFLGKPPVALAARIGARVLLVFNGIFISYFWLNGFSLRHLVLYVPQKTVQTLLRSNRYRRFFRQRQNFACLLHVQRF